MKYLLFLICALCTSLMWADNVTVEQAQAVATDFLQAHAQTRSGTPRLQLVWDGEDATTRTTSEPTLYVFNRTDMPGFVVVAGDDIALPILGYSFQHNFQSHNMPANLYGWLKGLRSQINEARQQQLPASEATTRAWKAASGSTGTTVVQLETAQWNQDSPYNFYCPTVSGKQAVTGCVATAMAIVMKYHQWPDCGEGTLPGYTYTSLQNVRITIPYKELGEPYDWSSMEMSYQSNSTLSSAKEVARLMYDCGVMAQSTYNRAEDGGTGAYTYDAAKAMLTYMKYDKGIRDLYRQSYPDNEWHELLKQELQTNGPVLYAGSDTEGGHMFVLDGYTTTNYFSVNWGWGGLCNGFYLLSGLAPNEQGIGGNSGGFASYQEAVVGIKKAEANSSYSDVLMISPSDKRGTGLTVSNSDFATDKNFTLRACYVFNMGFSKFQGQVVASLFDKDGEWKEDISAPTPLEIDAQFGYELTFSCRINGAIRGGDRIRLRYKGDTSDQWQPMYASFVEGTVFEIIVRPEGVSIEDYTQLEFNRTERILVVTTLPDVNYQLQTEDGTEISTGRTDAGNASIRIDTRSLTPGRYRLVLENEEDLKELFFVTGNQ